MRFFLKFLFNDIQTCGFANYGTLPLRRKKTLEGVTSYRRADLVIDTENGRCGLDVLNSGTTKLG